MRIALLRPAVDSRTVSNLVRTLTTKSPVSSGPVRPGSKLDAPHEPMADANKYEEWTHARLVQRVTELEERLKRKSQKLGLLLAANRGQTQPPTDDDKKTKQKSTFDPSRYSTRHIAIKFAYLGQGYNGFEYHANQRTPLPTVEEELWKALDKTKLIFPSSREPYSFEGCEYSKCGRTDKGVSAFGQVVGIRARSNRPKPKGEDGDREATPWDPVRDEVDYTRVLNRVLPRDIRVLAWCPSPSPDFSARFACRERRYRYFFTQPCVSPLSVAAYEIHRQPATASASGAGWLDIAAMREAAAALRGSHDFRNFCKQDPARQITNFTRNITHTSIEEADSCSKVLGFVDQADAPDRPKVYCFEVRGSAFLWHQVRCMVAVLFLVGQGFEKSSIVAELLDIEKNPRKPIYEMADDAPLVLWDCIFPAEGVESTEHDGLPWIYEGYQDPSSDHADAVWAPLRTLGVMWSNWRKRKIDEILAGSLLDLAVKRRSLQSSTDQGRSSAPPASSAMVFEGGNDPRARGKYVNLLQRERLDTPEVQLARFLDRRAAKPPVDSVDSD